MSECLPCQLEAAEAAHVVYRDDTWSCEVAEGYDVPGWFILRLRRHAEGWEGLSAEEAASFGPVSRKIACAIQEASDAPTVYFMSFGENYRHFHFLVITRPASLPPELKGAQILALRASERDMPAALSAAADVRSVLALG